MLYLQIGNIVTCLFILFFLLSRGVPNCKDSILKSVKKARDTINSGIKYMKIVYSGII